LADEKGTGNLAGVPGCGEFMAINEKAIELMLKLQ
jgi:hypothetical protein